MSDTTTHLLLPYILAAQAQKHVTHNEALRILDGLVQLSVEKTELIGRLGEVTIYHWLKKIQPIKILMRRGAQKMAN